jgi:hypothetical protein
MDDGIRLRSTTGPTDREKLRDRGQPPGLRVANVDKYPVGTGSSL